MATDSHGASRMSHRDNRDRGCDPSRDPRPPTTARQEEGRLVGEGSKQEREAEVRRICGHLAGEVAKLAPPGTGRRDDVWETVAGPDHALTLALTTWKLTGAEADKATARTAYRTLLNAWRSALSQPARRSA